MLLSFSAQAFRISSLTHAEKEDHKNLADIMKILYSKRVELKCAA
jgi:hypothetical protein